MVSVQEIRLTREGFLEFTARPENREKIFELVDGRIVEKVTSFTPSEIALFIGAALVYFVRPRNLGHVTTADGCYDMPNGDSLCPDVAFITKERLGKRPRIQVPVPPDFAVEVKSPSDRRKDMRDKTALYLNAGVRLVWLVFPDDRLVEIYSQEDRDGTPKYQGVLDCGDVVPGFSITFDEIFPVDLE